MKIMLIIQVVLARWLLIDFIWDRFHPDEPADHYDECPYD